MFKKKKKKKDIRISKLKIECQPNERIFEYSGPALVFSCQNNGVPLDFFSFEELPGSPVVGGANA